MSLAVLFVLYGGVTPARPIHVDDSIRKTDSRRTVTRSVLFPTHLLVATLLGWRWRLSPWWAVLGAALPDLVDKPLAAVGVTSLYHSVAHSAAFLLVLGAAWAAVRAVDPDADAGRSLAVTVGWGSHLLLDTVGLVLNGQVENVPFLLWPVLEPAEPLGLGPVAFLGHYLWTPAFYVELTVWVLGASLLGRRAMAWRRSRA